MNCLKKTLLIFGLTVLPLTGFYSEAQENCSEKLIQAQKMFEAGMIEQIPELLKTCIISGFSDNERIQAEKLLIQAYLFDSNIDEADNAMYAFLSRNPEYEIMASDPAEFVQLFQNYKIVQTGSVGIMFGSNYNFVLPTNIYSNNGKPGDYKNYGINYQTGVSFNYFLNKRFDINAEAYYSKLSYSFTNVLVNTGNFKQTFNESFHNIEIPISLLFKGKFNKNFSFILRAGGGFRYLIGSEAKIQLSSITSSKTSKMTSYRNPFQFEALGGVGLLYNMKKSFIMFDVRFNAGFMNIVNASKREKYGELQEFYLYNENDFIMHNMYFSIGYFYKFNKPQKSNN